MNDIPGVNFYSTEQAAADGNELKFAVIAARYNNKWLFVRKKGRDSYEIPGGHIERGESPDDAAKRELYEETGAKDFKLFPVGVYGVSRSDARSCGALYFAQIYELDELPADYEMEERIFSDSMPDKLSYPYIQPKLFEHVIAWLENNITAVIFIRHAESDHSVKDEAIRPLTAEGEAAAAELIEKYKGRQIDAVYSSPYVRAVKTVAPIAASLSHSVIERYGLRERGIERGRIEDFYSFSRRQWADFSYRLDTGECLFEVQKRNIAALNEILDEQRGKTVIVGTHGTALSTIVNNYMSEFGFEHFWAIVNVLPWIVEMEFIGMEFIRTAGGVNLELNADLR